MYIKATCLLLQLPSHVSNKAPAEHKPVLHSRAQKSLPVPIILSPVAPLWIPPRHDICKEQKWVYKPLCNQDQWVAPPVAQAQDGVAVVVPIHDEFAAPPQPCHPGNSYTGQAWGVLLKNKTKIALKMWPSDKRKAAAGKKKSNWNCIASKELHEQKMFVFTYKHWQVLQI